MKNNLKKFGLIAGSMAFGLVVGIYAVFMSGTNTQEAEITANQVQLEDSSLSNEAVANTEELLAMRSMLLKRDGGGLGF